jgi:quinol-cytochrome oxidoreductase complex cytochrome b subunit
MSPYFLIKDTITIALLAGFIVAVVCFVPNAIGHSDNYTPANPLVTPASIVPEWYLLPFYAILRAVPDKLGGVLAMLGALLILLVLPWTHTARVRSGAFRPIAEASTWMLYGVFALLIELGACHVEAPFVVLGQIASVLYFAYFVLLTPLVGHLENGLADLD